MKRICLWMMALACLTGLLVVRLRGRHHSNPRTATLPSQTVSASVSAADAVSPPKLTRESLNRVPPKPAQRTQEPSAPGADLALADTKSPINSQDPDQNRDWARTFPAEALAWLKNAPESKQRVVIGEILCPELAETNAAAAMALAENCVGGSTNDVAQNLLNNLAQLWAGRDLKAASAWAVAKPAGEQRDRLLQCIVFVESKTDPVEAARLVTQQISPGPTQVETAISVLYQWTQRDAPAALAWAESFPSGELRDRAIKEVKNVSAVLPGTQPAL